MITFEKFFKTLKEKGMTQLELSTKYKISRNEIQRLKTNQNVTIQTINTLCNILNCEPYDIFEYKKD